MKVSKEVASLGAKLEMSECLCVDEVVATSLPLLSCECSMSVKENRGRKKIVGHVSLENVCDTKLEKVLSVSILEVSQFLVG